MALGRGKCPGAGQELIWSGAGLACSQTSTPRLRYWEVPIYRQPVSSQEAWGCFSVRSPHGGLGRVWPWSQPTSMLLCRE